MTTRPTEERIAHLKTVTLPESSRMRMREELSAYADLHAFTGTLAPVPSPYFSYFSARMFRIGAALVVLISMLGGTAYAANDSQPGQPLYSVKLNLTEPVQTALIPSTEGKAAWHAILAERRLEEATTLAVEGHLDAQTQSTITDNFAKHVQDSSEAAAQLQQEGKVTAALSVRSDLEARITAHEDILTQVVHHLAVNATTTDNISEIATKNLLAVVQESQNAVEGERLALEDSLTRVSADATSTDSVQSSSTTTVRAVAIADTHGDSRAGSVVSAKVAVPMLLAVPRATITDTSRAARKTEIDAILFKNSALLKSLAPIATTTASSTDITASSTSHTDKPTENLEIPVKVPENIETEINIKK